MPWKPFSQLPASASCSAVVTRAQDKDRPVGHPVPGFVPQSHDDDDDFRAREGLRIVRDWGIKLNLKGKDHRLVGSEATL
jgi:hypothetical protein